MISAAAVVTVLTGIVTPLTADPPIRIGASLSLTGRFAALGQNADRGYQLCVKQTNARGGLLGRPIELAVHDDGSDPARAAQLFAQLLARDRVDLVFGPYSTPITQAVADLAERHKRPLFPLAATTSMFKAYRFLFMLVSPAEAYLEGFVDLAADHGLRTVAFMGEATPFPQAVVQGAINVAKQKGLAVRHVEAYPRGTQDFGPMLAEVRAAKPDALGAATYFNDAVAITRQLKDHDVNPQMFGVTIGGDLPKFYEALGRRAEFVYGASQWMPELVGLRAGGLIPISREYPGAKAFTEAYRTEFPQADFSYQSTLGYAGCQILLEAVRRTGSLDGETLRGAILAMDFNTAWGAFKVDGDGVQVAHKTIVFQWQDGQKVIVWPRELTPERPRFPTPPWSQRP